MKIIFNVAILLLLLFPIAWIAYFKPKNDRADNGATAVDGKPGVWRALSGDTLELDGEVAKLEGVACPATTSEQGQRAKALLNTHLAAGHVECLMSIGLQGRSAQCKVNGRDINSEIRNSGLC